MPFVVKGSANVVYAVIIVVKIVTVNHRGFVTVQLILQDVYLRILTVFRGDPNHKYERNVPE